MRRATRSPARARHVGFGRASATSPALRAPTVPRFFLSPLWGGVGGGGRETRHLGALPLDPLPDPPHKGEGVRPAQPLAQRLREPAPSLQNAYSLQCPPITSAAG